MSFITTGLFISIIIAKYRSGLIKIKITSILTICLSKTIKIVLQWHIPGGSPQPTATIKGSSAIDLAGGGGGAGGGMTVPVQRGSMAILQPPRSRFMITDILAGSGGGVRGGDSSEHDRSPSPGPRDLSVPPNSRHHHDNSDSDSSGGLDDHSICSNGEYSRILRHLNPFAI